MSIRIIIRYGNAVIFTVIGKEPQQVTCGKEALTGGGNLLLGNESFLVCLHQMEICISAVQVTSVPDGQGGAFRSGGGYLMIDVEIPDCPAVADHMAAESPFSAERPDQQCFTAAGRLTVHAVICAHDRFNLGFLNRRFKCSKICFRHILRRSLSIEFMAKGLGTGMYSKMLAACSGLQVFSMPLQAFYKAYAETACQIWILPVCLMPAPPSRIAEYVDVGAPYRKPFINITIAVAALSVEFCAGFIRNDIGNFLLKVFIKNSRQPDCLGEHSGSTRAGYSVKRFIPPVICGNT